MRGGGRARLLAAWLTLAGVPAAAQGVAPPPGGRTGPGAVLEAWGLFCEIVRDGTAPAPGTLSGRIHLIDRDQRPVLRSAEIPARLGLGFGLALRLAAPPGFDATVELEHPPMGPGGRTRQSWQTWIDAEEASVNTWQFDTPEELVPGDWRLRVTAPDGGLLADLPFRVLPPATGDVPAACAPAGSIS